MTSRASWLERHRSGRDELLERICAQLENDNRIAAAWLFGSLGRNDADELSDIDLWIVVSDPYIEEINTRSKEFASQIHQPILILDAPQNAPAGGAYLLALYNFNGGLQQVDWYWQRQSHASAPADVRIVLDRAELPRSGLHPLASIVGKPNTDRDSELVRQSTFFWAMLPIAAKKAARKQSWEALGMISMLRNTLRETSEILNARSAIAAILATSPPVETGKQIDMLFELGAAMEALTTGAGVNAQATQRALASSVYKYVRSIAQLAS